MAISSADLPLLKPESPPPQKEQVKSSYQPHLDGLRALAILGVLFEHFGVGLPVLLRFGPLSVRFFFVLSGYFITLSLWKLQTEITESNGGGSFLPVCRFYLSRLLRIGPPFYLALILGAIFGIDEVRTNFLWLATFQANNYIAYIGYWPEAISHFWSLAVQEQFYMIWPIVVLTLPKRWFLTTMSAFIVCGLLFRIYCIATDAPTLVRWVTLFGCFDSFAVGALIAYLRQSRVLDQMRYLSKTVLFAMPLVAFGCFFLGRALMTLPEDNLFLALTESVDAVFLAWALSTALVGVKGRYARILSWMPLVYLGRISYGVYVYHVFVIIIFSPLLVPYGLTEDHYAFARIAVLLLLTLVISSFSWHYVEKPFLAWKKALAPGRKRAPAPAEGQVTFA
ncbi:MAG: acyltransferase [Methylacidiphilales bacterium]|nr:acyltransferase [Candidatus Methylacidiphilales bacterium]